MFRALKNTKAIKPSAPISLQQIAARAATNHYGPLNKFQLGKGDLKLYTQTQLFVEKYRKYGHHYSRLDPLELIETYYILITNTKPYRKNFPSLSEFNLDQASSLKESLDPSSFIHKLSLKDIKALEQFLAKAYTSAVGVEFDHVIDAEERAWLYNQFEESIHSELSNDQKAKILKLLTEGEVIIPLSSISHKISGNWPLFE